MGYDCIEWEYMCLWLLFVKWCCMVICEVVVYNWKSAATGSLKSCILRNEQVPVARFLRTAGMHCSSTFQAFEWMHVVCSSSVHYGVSRSSHGLFIGNA